MEFYILPIITLFVQIVILSIQLIWNSSISRKLESYKQEISITNTTYSKFIEITLDYYTNIYQFYLICQNVANYTTVEYRDKPSEFYIEIYDRNLENFENKYNNIRGTMRLLLPDTIFNLDAKLLDAFNNFRSTIDLKSLNYKVINNTVENKKKIMEAFKLLHIAKENLEISLKKVLRVEGFFKN